MKFDGKAFIGNCLLKFLFHKYELFVVLIEVIAEVCAFDDGVNTVQHLLGVGRAFYA